MRRRRSRNKYKFSGKKQYPKGIASFGLGILGFIGLVLSIRGAFYEGGDVSLYYGSLAIVIFVDAIIALVLGIDVCRDEEAYKVFPGFGIAFSAMTILSWVGIFILGILM